MRHNFAQICVIAALAGLPEQASAAQPQFLSTEDLFAAYDNGDPMLRQLVLLGLAQTETGMALANAELKSRGTAPLYCTPPALVLTGEQILDMLRRYAMNHPDIAQGSYALAILRAAQEVFPCR